MKKLIFSFVLLCYCSLSFSQVVTIHEVPAKVISWKGLGLFTTPTFFSETQDSIIAQIGGGEFNIMKANCQVHDWPRELQGQIFTKKDSLLKKQYYAKMDQLKVFKIASYAHYYRGEYKGRFCILKVPYKKNRHWDENVTWNVVYFIMQEETVEEIGQEK